MPYSSIFLPTDEPSVRTLGLNEMETLNKIIYLGDLTEIWS